MNVAVLGFGGMGHFHAAVYARRDDVKLVAVADSDPERLQGKSMAINIGAGRAFDMTSVRPYASADELLEQEPLDLVSVCLPTDLHARYAIRALDKGVSVLCEKPMSRTLREADAEMAAQKRGGALLMVGQCLRFWPCYERLENAFRNGEFGRLLMLSLRRVSAPPGWATGARPWFLDGRRSGGCLLDMHIHDTDFVQHLLGTPEAVVTTGRSTHTRGAIDSSFTQYVYPRGPIVMAESTWAYGGGFRMGFSAVFEQATLEMGYRDAALTLLKAGQPPEAVALPAGDGYEGEIGYFIECVRRRTPPVRCAPESTRETMRIALAEERSALAGGKRVRL